jgi:hypothetical protein
MEKQIPQRRRIDDASVEDRRDPIHAQ